MGVGELSAKVRMELNFINISLQSEMILARLVTTLSLSTIMQTIYETNTKYSACKLVIER